MLIVLANPWDTSAVSLVSKWRERDARLLTPDCLSERGWVWRPAAPEASTFVIDGRRIPVRSIDGVVTLVAAVHPSGLDRIVEGDREYVAVEMMAFLVAWLSWLPTLGIPVVNRPTPLSLAGPALQETGWLRAAAAAALPIRPLSRHLPGPGRSGEPDTPADGSTEPPIAIPVIGDRCLPGADGVDAPFEIRSGLLRLAATLGVQMLTAFLAGGDGRLVFTGAAPTADVTRDDVADALLGTIDAS